MKIFWASLGAFAIFFYIGRRDRLRELQGLWSDYVRGEWWIDEDGNSDYADGDIGDQNHEMIAANAMLDVDVLRDWLEEKGTPSGDDIDASEIFFNYGNAIPEHVGVKATGSREAWYDVHKDPRTAYMKHKKAIRVIDNQFQAWKVTPKTIRAIQSFLYDQSAGDDAPEGDTEVCVEEVGTRKYACKPVSEFLTIKMPGKLWR